MGVLDGIDSPADLRSLPVSRLPELAAEIRSRIIATVSRNGGHLGSNLGTVELTLMLHYLFDTPRDRIVWDVGHQAYTHKLITGRRERFDSLRTFGGISGFPNRAESPYDTFTVGHASTAVSAGLGMAVARDLCGERHRVIAVLGDGSLTGGITYEALNHAGHLNTDLIVVLNDNAMFISSPVGAVAKMLVRLLTLGLVKQIEKRIEQFFRRLHLIGAFLLRVAKRFKLLLFPGMLFEEMGFAYIGPVDGHGIRELHDVFRHVRNLRGPILVHVVTRKGKGYESAENRPTKYHGVGAFDPQTGTLLSVCGRTFTAVFGEAAVDLAAADPRIVGITAAMTDGCGLERFAERYPDRFFDVGIAEQHAVTFAAGLAAEGKIPICAIYSTFLQRAYDQIIHDVALPNLHVIFAVDRAGLVGEDGPTHHGAFDVSYLRAVPNLLIMAPKDGAELRDMLLTAVRHDGPVAIRYPRETVRDQDCSIADPRSIPIGSAETLASPDGARIALLACGPTAYIAVEAAAKLREPAAVINLRFLKPLDEQVLAGIRAPYVVTLEENTVIGGVYSAVCEFYARRSIGKKILSVALPDRFITHGPRRILLEQCGLTPDTIAARIEAFVGQ